MALIKCINCGHMISDKAVKCPKCGTPIQMIKEAAKTIEKEEKVIAEIESPKVEIAKADKPINESPKDEEPLNKRNEVEAVVPDEPKSQTWKKVSGIVVFAAIIIGGIYFYMDSQNKAQLEKEALLKAKADSAFVADSLARVAAAEQARQDSINAVEAIRQNLVRFADVYVNLSNSETEHINKDLLEVLKSRGYGVLHKDEKSEYHETFDATFNYKHYYLGINMEYHGYWKATGEPCNGVEFLISDMPSASAIIHFENSDDLEAFLKDAEKAGFRKGDYGWSRESDYPYDNIKKIDDTTIECNSTMPY
jgi:hypothetical protein